MTNRGHPIDYEIENEDTIWLHQTGLPEYFNLWKQIETLLDETTTAKEVQHYQELLGRIYDEEIFISQTKKWTSSSRQPAHWLLTTEKDIEVLTTDIKDIEQKWRATLQLKTHDDIEDGSWPNSCELVIKRNKLGCTYDLRLKDLRIRRFTYTDIHKVLEFSNNFRTHAKAEMEIRKLLEEIQCKLAQNQLPKTGNQRTTLAQNSRQNIRQATVANPTNRHHHNTRQTA